MRKTSLAIAIFTPCILLVAPAAPALAADACVVGHYTSYASDYARATDVSGTCAKVGVRHRYNPPVSSNYYYTSWKWGASSAQSTTAAELSSAQFDFVE